MGRGSGGDVVRDGSTNGDGSIRGGDGVLGATGGSSMTSLGKDDDGWIYSRMTGIGPVGGGGAITGADGGASGRVMVGLPAPPEGPGLGMNTGDGDLLLMVLLRPLRRLRSPSRKV